LARKQQQINTFVPPKPDAYVTIRFKLHSTSTFCPYSEIYLQLSDLKKNTTSLLLLHSLLPFNQ